MPKYEVQGPDGRKFDIEGDSPPNEQELEEIFSSLPKTGTPDPGKGGRGYLMPPDEAKRIAQENLVASDPERLMLLDAGTKNQNVHPKGQGAIPRFLAATVGGGFTSGPARMLQDLLLKTGLTSPEVVDTLGVNRIAQENPGTVLGGNLVGGLAPAGKVFQGASAMGRVGKAALMGGGYGASESIAEGGLDRLANDKTQIAKDTAESAALSSLLPGLMEARSLKGLAQRALVGKVSPENKEIIQAAKELDIPITPSQALGSRPLALTEKALQNIPTSSGVIQNSREAVRESLQKKSGQLLDSSAPKVSEQAFGQELQSRLIAREGRFKDTASKLYNKFETAVPEGTQIQLGRARDLAQDFIERETKKEGLGSTKLISQLKTFIGEPDAAGVSVPKSTDVRTFLDIRAAVNDEINSAVKNERGDVARKLGMIKSQMDKSLEDFAKLQGGKIEESFQLANSYYAKRAQTFSDPKIQRMIQKDPGLLYDVIAQPGTVKEINTLRTALGPNKFSPVQRAVMEKILATDGVDAFSPEKFGTSLKKFTPENLEAVFGKGKVDEINKFWKVTSAIVKNEKMVGNPAGTAQNVITPGYYGGVYALTMSNPIAGGTAFFGPPAMAKLYTSKAGMRFLTEAVKTPVGSPRASQIIAKISAILAEDDEPEMNEVQRDNVLKKLASD
jgi:hypothetical protein